MNLNKIITTAVVALLNAVIAGAQSPQLLDSIKGEINLFVANDTGRNGYYKQKAIADKMGEMADAIGPEAVIAIGDIHHYLGIESVDDPLWMTNYELIYTHPELMIPWHPVLGNHEYEGNTQAVIDYSSKSRRWQMPARYYTKSWENDGTTIRLVMVDTAPLIDKYRNSDEHPDARKQDMNRQLLWVDSVLNTANEDWVIVAGHHPIYAQTSKTESERTDLQKRLKPILLKHKVAAYINGHIHNFQDITMPDSPIHYVTNSAGALSRKVKPTEGTQYCSPSEGFSIITADKDRLSIHFIDADGNRLHVIELDKQK